MSSQIHCRYSIAFVDEEISCRFPLCSTRRVYIPRQRQSDKRATAHDPILQRYNETTAADEIGYDDMREQIDKAKKKKK